MRNQRFDLDKLSPNGRMFAVDIFTQLSGQDRMSLQTALELGVLKYGLTVSWTDHLIRHLQWFGAIYRSGPVKGPRTIELTWLGFEWWVEQQGKQQTRPAPEPQPQTYGPLDGLGMTGEPEHETNLGPIDW